MSSLYSFAVLFAVVTLWTWPLGLPDKLIHDLPIGVIMGSWGATSFAGTVLLFASVTRYLRAQGRAWTHDRPQVGLGGKSWGVLVPEFFMPPSLLFGFVFIGFALVQNSYSVQAWLGLAIISLLAYAYLSPIRRIASQRRSLLARTDAAWSITANPEQPAAGSNSKARQALNTIATLMRVPPSKLLASDRFGYEIGTFSTLDETVDRLGGLLLIRLRRSGRPLFLDHVKTVGDYIREWEKCV